MSTLLSTVSRKIKPDSTPEVSECVPPSADLPIQVTGLIEGLIEEAHKLGASDVHIDPREENVRVRVRVDGVLKDLKTYPKRIHCEIISRIKVMAALRIDERRLAQDGRFRHLLSDGTFVDVRTSTAPTYHGENAVMRLLADHSDDFTLDMLGFNASDQKKIAAAIARPNGMILVTGPTGSGKTTTLYTLIKMLNSAEISIVTIEDPIEYAIEDIKQMQVHAKNGLTFAAGLRSILRQDPDVIMVGEIRDTETAGVAINTSLTGHLLLSTLHTNDAATTLPRLSDMGIDPYLVASTINLVIGQRLVRTICTKCRVKTTVTPAMAKTLSAIPLRKPILKGEKLWRGKGCEACNGTGYRGRTCVNEVLVASTKIQDAIMRKASASELTALAVSEGMTTMLEDAFKKVRSGETTVEEVLR